MKKYDAITLAIGAGAAIGALLLASPDANADPRIPQPGAGYCPGGGDGGYGMGFCDGLPFADGTFIHTARGFIPFKGYTVTTFCAATHDLMPAPAGPGGCGGLI